MAIVRTTSILFILVCVSAFNIYKPKPVLYIIGDSTVKNGDGKTNNQLQGWASFVDLHFDTTKLGIENHAIGGRSSRTFITDGRWDKILARLKKGDYVLMQFGHNDASPLDDTARARGTIKGIGEDSLIIYNPIRKQQETMFSYGWYMRKYVREAKARGAIPIICSPVPRNNWKNGQIERTPASYTAWGRQVAEANGALFIDLHNRVADEYDLQLGEEKVALYFPTDHTHTNKEGAMLNARIVTEGVIDLKRCKLKRFLL